MKTGIYLAAWLAGFIFSSPLPALAGDLRLTPNQVYSTWTNINDCLLTIAQEQALGATTQTRLAAMEPSVFTDMQPSDVLGRVREFEVRLNRLRGRWDLPSVPQIPEVYDLVTPREVYLNSGRVTDALAEILILISGPERPVSPYYVYHKFSGMSPNDVFGLVELAIDRLDIILSAGGSS